LTHRSTTNTPPPHPPPSLPPTVTDAIVTLFFTSILVACTVVDDAEIHSAYVELLDNNYTFIELKQAEDIPSGAIEYSAIFDFLNLAPSRSYIVKMYAVDTNDNITSKEKYTNITDMTVPVINSLTTISRVP